MKTRTKLIVSIVKMSTAYSCGQIKYELVGDDVHITSTSELGTFGATELCSHLSSFNMFFTIEEGVITLKVY